MWEGMSTTDCWGPPVVKTFPIRMGEGGAQAPPLSRAPFRRKRTGEASFRGRGEGIMNGTKLEQFLASTHLKHICIFYGSCKIFSPLTIFSALESTAWNLPPFYPRVA